MTVGQLTGVIVAVGDDFLTLQEGIEQKFYYHLQVLYQLKKRKKGDLYMLFTEELRNHVGELVQVVTAVEIVAGILLSVTDGQ